MKNIVYFFLMLIVTTACKKAPDYPKEPYIEFKSIEKYVIVSTNSLTPADSVVINIAFKDGDGDIGLDEEDLSQPAYKDSSKNYILDVYRKIDGKFVLLNLVPNYYGTIPRLSPRGTTGPIDGTIKRDDITFKHTVMPENDTLKFEIKILDRAFNISNRIETSEIIIHEK